MSTDGQQERGPMIAAIDRILGEDPNGESARYYLESQLRAAACEQDQQRAALVAALRGLIDADGRCHDLEDGCGFDCPWHAALGVAEAALKNAVPA